MKNNNLKDRWDVARTLFNQAKQHQEAKRFSEAEKEYEEALGIIRELAEENPSSCRTDVARTLNNLAKLHQEAKRFSEAEKEYEEALGIFREFAEENPSAYRPDVAMILNNLAELHQDTNRLSETEREYEEALEIRREFAEENPSAYRPYVAMTLNNIAILHADTDRLPEAEREYEEALGIFRELAEENPSAYRPDVATTLNNLAFLHKHTDRLPEAEREYEEALRIRRELAEENPSVYRPDVATTLNNLANLHVDTNRHYTALQEFQEAGDICRRYPSATVRLKQKLEKNYSKCFTNYLQGLFADGSFDIEQNARYSYSAMTDVIGYADYLVKRDGKPLAVIVLKHSADDRQDFIPNQMPLVMESMGVRYGIYVSEINRSQFFSSSGKTDMELAKIMEILLEGETQNPPEESKVFTKDLPTTMDICNSIKILFNGMKKNFRNHGEESLEKYFTELNENSFSLDGDTVRFSSQEDEDKFFLAILGRSDGRICRYTSLDSLFRTLDGCTHTMCNINCMNDPFEVMYADNYINPKNRDASEIHDELLSETNSAFIVSCSESFDDLMMWRLYGDDAKGVCIIYDVGEMQPGFSLAKINYAKERGDHPELDFIKSIGDEKTIGKGRRFVWHNWNTWKHFFKTSDYASEKEVRLLYIKQKDSEIDEKWIIDNTNSVISPMLLFELGKHEMPLVISEILLGCKVRQLELNARQLEYLIKKKGIFGSLRIGTSKVQCYR